MFRPIALFLLLGFTTSTLSAQKNVGDTYKVAGIVDSTYGIIMYNSLITISGIDSVRYDAMKLPIQGLVIDMYDNGQMLHKGSYNKGRLVSFNNYYPDGKKERSFITLSTSMCTLKVFYENGKLKSEVDYRDGIARKWTDFYENSQIEFEEENSSGGDYLLSRKAFKENGKPDYELQLLSSKNRKYEQKEFYPDGKLHTKGELLFFTDANDMRKDGICETYNEKGNVILQELFVKGEVTETKDSLSLNTLADNKDKKVDSRQSAVDNKEKKKEEKKVDNKQEIKKEPDNKQADTSQMGYATKEKIKREEKIEAQKKETEKKENEKKEAEKKKTEARNKKIAEKKSADSLNSLTAKEKKTETEKKKTPLTTASNNKSETIKKAPDSHSPQTIPAEFRFADKDKNGKITAPEVSQAINAFFDDETGKLKAGDISKLIDYFFDQ